MKLIVIGGGVAGYAAALRAARLGGQVTLIEKDALGGTCLNRGCIPTKCLLRTAEAVREIRRAGTFGIKASFEGIDLGAVMRRKDDVVKRLARGLGALVKAGGVKLVGGTATLRDERSVEIVETGEIIRGERIVIATGSVPGRLPTPGSIGGAVMDSDAALALDRLPQSVIVIGGGVVGVEFAQFFHGLGVETTIIEGLPSLLAGLDSDLSSLFQRCLVRDGMRVVTGAMVKEVGERAGRPVVRYERDKEGEVAVTAEKVLIAVGRRPAHEGLGIERLFLPTRDGAIVVDERMETPVRGVYAAGDVTGPPMLAHAGLAQGACAAANALGGDEAMTGRAVPLCVYTNPEIASVGLSEEAAKERHGHVRTARFPLRANGKALILNETEGFVKVVAEGEGGRIVGVHILGPHATELAAAASMVVTLKLTAREAASVVHPHPTLSEAFWEAAAALCGEAVHVL